MVRKRVAARLFSGRHPVFRRGVDSQERESQGHLVRRDQALARRSETGREGRMEADRRFVPLDEQINRAGAAGNVPSRIPTLRRSEEAGHFGSSILPAKIRTWANWFTTAGFGSWPSRCSPCCTCFTTWSTITAWRSSCSPFWCGVACFRSAAARPKARRRWPSSSRKSNASRKSTRIRTQRNKAMQEFTASTTSIPSAVACWCSCRCRSLSGLYRSLVVDVELRQAPLISSAVRWCSNLAAPDMLWNWHNVVPGFCRKLSWPLSERAFRF